MYSFAPAWIAATAARASVPVPQATIGIEMRSASSRVTRSRMSTATSTIIRSAPRPERSTRSAISAFSAWVTAAPLFIAILVAMVSCPCSVPTISRRMSLAPFSLDDFRHGDAEFLLDQHDFAARHQTVVDVDVDRFADLAVQFEYGARPQPEQFADIHAGAAEHCGNLHRDVENSLEVCRTARRVLGVWRERGFITARDDIRVRIEFG